MNASPAPEIDPPLEIAALDLNLIVNRDHVAVVAVIIGIKPLGNTHIIPNITKKTAPKTVTGHMAPKIEKFLSGASLEVLLLVRVIIVPNMATQLISVRC